MKYASIAIKINEFHSGELLLTIIKRRMTAKISICKYPWYDRSRNQKAEGERRKARK